jgi:hypothetical protein
MSTEFMRDATERVAATVVIAGLAALLAWLTAGAPGGKVAMIAAAIPVVSGLLDVAKVLFARFVGDPNSASLNP